MKCRKAIELYFSSRDGLLDESGRLRLAEHLGRCESCARYVAEMEASLDALAGLPELAPSDGFEWNVKRRIHEERNRLLSRGGSSIFSARRWVPSFAAAAAAAAAVVIAALYGAGSIGGREPSVRAIAASERPAAALGSGSANYRGSFVEYAPASKLAGPRLVSDNLLAVGRDMDGMGLSAFRFVATSREDSLMRENELLRSRVEGLERRLIYIQRSLDRERSQRINLSLP